MEEFDENFLAQILKKPESLDDFDDPVIENICRQAIDMHEYQTVARLMRVNTRFEKICKNMVIQRIQQDLVDKFMDPLIPNKKIGPYRQLYRILNLENQYVTNVLHSLTAKFERWHDTPAKDSADAMKELMEELVRQIRRKDLSVHPATKQVITRRLLLLRDEIQPLYVDPPRGENQPLYEDRPPVEPRGGSYKIGKNLLKNGHY